MIRRGGRKAATVIEALIAVFVGSLVIVVVLGLVNFSTKSFGRTQQRLDPREQASRIVNAVRRHLTDAQFYRIGENGRRVKFVTPRGPGELTYDDVSGRIEVRSSQTIDAQAAVLAGHVKAFSIHQLRRGVLRVSVTVDRPVVYDGLASLGPLAMVDEILCPAAARQRMIPWNRAHERRPPGRGGRGPRRPRGDDQGPPPDGAIVAD